VASSFTKLGFAFLLALLYQLHLPPKQNLPAIFREERKRTFWSLYLQDRLMCSSRERLCVLRDEECRIQLPCSESAFRAGQYEDAPTLDQVTGHSLDQEVVDNCSPLAIILVIAAALRHVSEYMLSEARMTTSGPPWAANSPYSIISATLLQLEHHFGMSETYKEIVVQKCSMDGNLDQAVAGPMMLAKALFHLTHCLLHHPFLLQQLLKRTNQRAPRSFTKTA